MTTFVIIMCVIVHFSAAVASYILMRGYYRKKYNSWTTGNRASFSIVSILAGVFALLASIATTVGDSDKEQAKW